MPVVQTTDSSGRYQDQCVYPKLGMRFCGRRRRYVFNFACRRMYASEMVNWVRRPITSLAFMLFSGLGDEAERLKVLEDAVQLIFRSHTSYPLPEKSQFSTHFTGCAGTTEVTCRSAQRRSSLNLGVLQSWESSIVVAERLCSDPSPFSIILPKTKSTMPINRDDDDGGKTPLPVVLELGVGTGLFLTSKIAQFHPDRVDIVATDYHPDVLWRTSRQIEIRTPDQVIGRPSRFTGNTPRLSFLTLQRTFRCSSWLQTWCTILHTLRG